MGAQVWRRPARVDLCGEGARCPRAVAGAQAVLPGRVGAASAAGGQSARGLRGDRGLGGGPKRPLAGIGAWPLISRSRRGGFTLSWERPSEAGCVSPRAPRNLTPRAVQTLSRRARRKRHDPAPKGVQVVPGAWPEDWCWLDFQPDDESWRTPRLNPGSTFLLPESPEIALVATAWGQCPGLQVLMAGSPPERDGELPRRGCSDLRNSHPASASRILGGSAKKGRGRK